MVGLREVNAGGVGLLIVLALCAVPVAAGAQKTGAQLQDELDAATGDTLQLGESAGQAVHRAEGAYRGVVPGRATENPPRVRKSGLPTITWLGFQRTEDGRSRLFLQLSRDADVSQQLVDGKLLIHIAGARFGTRNTSRRLDTRFFDTAIRQVTARRTGKQRARKGNPGHKPGVQLVVEFKIPSAAVQAPVASTAEADGYYYIYLGFDSGPPAVEQNLARKSAPVEQGIKDKDKDKGTAPAPAPAPAVSSRPTR
jgi:hypothetical protein